MDAFICHNIYQLYQNTTPKDVNDINFHYNKIEWRITNSAKLFPHSTINELINEIFKFGFIDERV